MEKSLGIQPRINTGFISISDFIGKVQSGEMRIADLSPEVKCCEGDARLYLKAIASGLPLQPVLILRTTINIAERLKIGNFTVKNSAPTAAVDYVIGEIPLAESIFRIFHPDGDLISVVPEGYPEPESVNLEYRVLESNDLGEVSEWFEALAGQGYPIDGYHLLIRTKFVKDYNVQIDLDDFSNYLASYGFDEYGMDAFLMMRTVAGVLGSGLSARELAEINPTEIVGRRLEVTNGYTGAIKFLRANFNIHSGRWLPYPEILIPLTVLFSAPGNKKVKLNEEQVRKISRWFWRTAFGKRYADNMLERVREDTGEIHKLKSGEESRLGDFEISIDETFFRENLFHPESSETRTFVLLLASNKPLGYLSGEPIVLDQVLGKFDRGQFHQVYPKQYLPKTRTLTAGPRNECLANFTFITNAENREMGGIAPSVYRQMMPQNHFAIRDSQLLPQNTFDDKFEGFVSERCKMLVERAGELIK